ncbi:hypothetical protein [Variovorax sp. GB1P17]|uniref:hypothetical protein n=1 Tax=Variovorax sp. GB1P17 TaxID=3443740 RepID=UPI003F45BEF3
MPWLRFHTLAQTDSSQRYWIEQRVTGQEIRYQWQDYVRQTSDLRFPEENHVPSFLVFAEEMLELLRELWPIDAGTWASAMRLRRNEALSMAQWRDVQDQISAYRASLGEPNEMSGRHGDQAALSFLFALAIESPEVSPSDYKGTALTCLLDEFASKFINHFGHGPELVETLKRAFHCTSA